MQAWRICGYNMLRDMILEGQFSDIISSSFTEKLYYTDGLGIPRYNGNISSQQWKIANEDHNVVGVINFPMTIAIG